MSVSVAMVICMVAMATAENVRVEVDVNGEIHYHHEIDPDDEDTLNKASEDAEHIQDHYKGQVKLDFNSMPKEEKEFHFFKQHDFNHDGQLDGIEIYHAFGERVRHPQYPTEGSYEEREKEYLEKVDRLTLRLTKGIDRMLNKIDSNDDGYVTYVEFAAARKNRFKNPMFSSLT
ncbi:unnamed protein product [Owenia fusiformis]|uniref:Uncharacterized protein n=1 Tax=Owenia fusiformis TaxID=6347 RepID=A0A8J1U4R5_OWEFU|nr:unnamed protein product [Owenia fusiformis]